MIFGIKQKWVVKSETEELQLNDYGMWDSVSTNAGNIHDGKQ